MPAYAMYKKKSTGVRKIVKSLKEKERAQADAYARDTRNPFKPLKATRTGKAECYVGGKRVPCYKKPAYSIKKKKI